MLYTGLFYITEEEYQCRGNQCFQTFIILLQGRSKQSNVFRFKRSCFLPSGKGADWWTKTSAQSDCILLSSRRLPGVLTRSGSLLDPTVPTTPGLQAGFWAGGVAASLGSQALPGAARWTSLGKITDGERSGSGISEGSAWIHRALLRNLDLQHKYCH